MVASSKLAMSHQINDGRACGCRWRSRLAWSVVVERSVSHGGMTVLLLSAQQRRLRKERVECGEN